MSGADAPDQPGGAEAWPSNETNSVQRSRDGTEAERSDAQRVQEVLDEFTREYPTLADQELSRQHGRKLRRRVTDPEYETETVDPEEEWQDGFTVDTLWRRDASTWEDALAAFLHAHLDYEGLTARFEDPATGDTFETGLSDAWSPEYARKGYARAKAIERQVGGGYLPMADEDDPEEKYRVQGEWDDVVTMMLTLTASSRPEGQRLAPVDHLDQLHDSWTESGGCRETLRNALEYHLGLDSDQWGYWLQAEPHGAGHAADPDKNPGANACHTHLHVAVYLDASALEVDDLHQVGVETQRVVDKHLERAEAATRPAHDYADVHDYTDVGEDQDSPISVNPEVEDLGCYMAAYLGGYGDDGTEEDVMDKPVEYQAWGALYWSAARRRSARSNLVNEMVRSDRCQQRYHSSASEQEVDHGDHVAWDDGHGRDVVCATCGSSWGIDQDRLEEPVPDDDLREALEDETEEAQRSGAGQRTDDEGGGERFPESPAPEAGPTTVEDVPLDELWQDADSALRFGESLTRAEIREQLERVPPDLLRQASVEELLGRLGLPPGQREFVQEVIEDGDDPGEAETFQEAPELDPSWDLVAVVDKDDEEHLPSGGGVDMVRLEKPESRLMEHPRFAGASEASYSGKAGRCRLCGVNHHNPRGVAEHLVYEHGVTDPDVANRCASFVCLKTRERLPDHLAPPDDVVEGAF